MTVIWVAATASAKPYSLTLGKQVLVANSPNKVEALLTQHPDQMLVVIAADVDTESALEVAENLRKNHPVVGIILVRNKPDLTVLVAAMRAGIRQVVDDFDAVELLAATERSLSFSAALLKQPDLNKPVSHKPSRGKISVVFSAKGGCGKTTVSTNYAAALAANNAQKRVCLVDFDLQFGDIAVALRAPASPTIADAIALQTPLSQQQVANLTIALKPNLSVLLAPTNPATVELLSPQLTQQILLQLQSLFAYVVIDSPPAFTEHILQAFNLADEILLLTNLDTPSIKNLQLTLETLELLGVDAHKMKVVVNRATVNAGIKVSDVSKAIGWPVAVSIPTSDDVVLATNTGKTIFDEKPNHAVAKAIRKLVALQSLVPNLAEG